MKKLFIILGLAVATLSAPLSAQAQTLQERVAAEFATWVVAKQNAFIASVENEATRNYDSNKMADTNNYFAQTEWVVFGQEFTGTFAQAVHRMTSQVRDALIADPDVRYQYQVNSSGEVQDCRHARHYNIH